MCPFGDSSFKNNHCPKGKMIQSHNKVFLFVKVAGFLQELRAAARERERAKRRNAPPYVSP